MEFSLFKLIIEEMKYGFLELIFIYSKFYILLVDLYYNCYGLYICYLEVVV